MKSGEKLQKVGKAGQKWRKVGKSREKCGKLWNSSEKGRKVAKVGKSGEKWEKVAKSWKKWRKVRISGESWGKKGKSGKKLDFFLQNGRWRPFWMTKNHFWSHFSPFQINTQLLFFEFFFKMAAGRHFGSPFWAILDDRKSLSIAFFTISDQYATFFFDFFFQNGRQRPFCKSDLRQKQ